MSPGLGQLIRDQEDPVCSVSGWQQREFKRSCPSHSTNFSKDRVMKATISIDLGDHYRGITFQEDEVILNVRDGGAEGVKGNQGFCLRDRGSLDRNRADKKNRAGIITNQITSTSMIRPD